MAAYTCASVRPDPGGSIAGSRRIQGGTQRFRARADSFVYRAYLDPACSWWNETSRNPPAYVLQHEQIHFALFELEARRMNQELAREPWAAEADTLDEAIAGLQARIQARLREALESALRVNREFDEDTSMGYRPRKQSEWWAHTMSELDRLPPGAVVRAPVPAPTPLPRDHAECLAAGGEREPAARGGRCFFHTTPQRNRAEYVRCREEGGAPRMLGRGTTRAAAGQSHVCTLVFEPGDAASAEPNQTP